MWKTLTSLAIWGPGFFFIFFRGHVGPLHKIQGWYRNVIKYSPHHSGDICTRGKQLENQFFIYEPKCIFWAI